MKKKAIKSETERFQDSPVLERIGGRTGIKVPEGYFEDFVAKMSAALPERPELEYPEKILVTKSTWQRIRPYVYLAAMFAGIWCMLKMFTLMSGNTTDAAIDSNPVLAEALASESFMDDYIAPEIDQWDMVDQIIDDNLDPADLFENYDDMEELEALDFDGSVTLPTDCPSSGTSVSVDQ